MSDYPPMRIACEATANPRLAISLVCLLALAPLGCSEGPSKADLRRYALSNKFSEVGEGGGEKETSEAKKKDEQQAARASQETAAETVVAAQTALAVESTETAPEETEPNAGKPAAKAPAEETKKIKTLGPIPPDLTPAGRYARSVENVERIAAAFRSYYERTGHLPKQGYPKVSWRVSILPDLGYQELYDQYDPEQDWFSPANKALLAQIPPEYQSPERRDSKTNYLLVTGPDTVYSRPGGGARAPGDSENLIALVEVNDDRAEQWLAPEDHPVDLRHPRGILKGLGGLRPNEFLAMTGDMRVIAMPARLGVRTRLKPNFVDEESAGDPAFLGRDVAEIRYTAFAESSEESQVADADEGDSADLVSEAGPPEKPELGPLTEQCWRAASIAANYDNRGEAWLWARGATAAGARSELWERDYHWYPALKRPSLGLQVAVALSGQPNPKQAGSGTRSGDVYQEDLFRRQTGDFGQRFLRELNELTRGSAAPPLREGAIETSRNQRDAEPSALTYVMDASNIQQAATTARETEADVLVFLSASNVPTGREVAIQVYDLFRGKRLLKTERALVWSQRVDAQRLAENQNRLLWEVKDFFEDNLSPRAWPVKMTPRMARRRLESLGSRSGRAMPLVALTEMQHYRQSDLIDEAELVAGAQRVVGKSDALDLVLGDETKRRRVMREWLPSDDPAEYVALAERQRVAVDEDD